MNKIGFAVTGSFCSMDDMLDVLKQLCQNYEVEVFVTPHVYKMDTRFYSHSELISHIQNITGKKVHTTIQEAEIYGDAPRRYLRRSRASSARKSRMSTADGARPIA